MEKFFDLAKHVGILLFYLAQVAFLPGLIAYLAEKARLKNGTPPTRCRLFVLIAVLLILASVVWMILDPEGGAFTMIFALLGAAVLLGITLGIKASQSDFRRKNRDR